MALHDNFPSYGGSGPRILGLGIGLGSVGTVLVALRVYVRIRITRFGTPALAWSLAAWTITVTAQVFGILAAFHGAGNDISIVDATHALDDFLLYSWLTVFFFSLALPLGKVAVAAFLLEICAQVGPKVRASLLAIAAINIITSIPLLLIVWLQCSPVNALWDPRRQGQCDYRISVYYTYVVGSIAALSDFYLAIMPIIILKPLHISTRRKVGLCFLMGCGVFAGIAAILRTYAARLTLTRNTTRGVGVVFHWVQVEEWLVLITMSIPPVWPVFRRALHRVTPYREPRALRSAPDPTFREYTSTSTRPRTPAASHANLSTKSTRTIMIYQQPSLSTSKSTSLSTPEPSYTGGERRTSGRESGYPGRLYGLFPGSEPPCTESWMELRDLSDSEPRYP